MTEAFDAIQENMRALNQKIQEVQAEFANKFDKLRSLEAEIAEAKEYGKRHGRFHMPEFSIGDPIPRMVVLKYTTGAPTHKAVEGTLCWVVPDLSLWVNDDNNTHWTPIGGVGAGSGPWIIDYIVDLNYTGTDGTSYTALNGHTFLVYNDIASAITHAEALAVGTNSSFAFAPGTHTISATTTKEPPNNGQWSIYGVAGDTILSAGANSIDLLSFGTLSSAFIHIEGLRFNTNGKTSVDCITNSSNWNGRITNCYFVTDDTTNTGIKIDNAVHMGVDNCVFSGTGTGIDDGGLIQHAHINNCFFTGNTIGVDISGGNRTIITNCNFGSSGTNDINIGGTGAEVVITGNEFGTGIKVGGAPWDNVNISHNTFRLGGSEIGIDNSALTVNSNAFTYIGNTFRGGASTVGIKLDAQMVDGVIMGNTFEGFTSGNEITGTGGGVMGMHNTSDAGSLADFGSPVGHATGAAVTTHDHTYIEDTDADTKVQTEESADEDIIRFDTGGTERATLSTGLLLKSFLQFESEDAGIVSGTATCTRSYVQLVSEGGTTDTIDHLSMGTAVTGTIVIIAPKSGHTITVDSSLAPVADSIFLANDVDVELSDSTAHFIFLIRRGTVWAEFARANEIINHDLLINVSADDHHAQAHGTSVHTENGNWKVKYTDGSGDEVELALGADGTFLKSTGASGAPAFEEDYYMLEFVIDGGGSAITTGIKGDLEVPTTGTITGWTVLADQAGDIVVDVWKDTYANYPPDVADTIAGTEKPTLSAVAKNQDLALGTWTTAVTRGDTIRFNVDSVATVTRVLVSIRVTKS